MAKDIIEFARQFYEAGLVDTNEIVQKYKEAERYYAGDPSIVPHDPGRSKVVSMDFRKLMRKIMPSVSNTIFDRDEIVIYHPVGDEDEQVARQITQYVNQQVIADNRARVELETAVRCAMFCGVGWLTARHEKRQDIAVTHHTQLTKGDLILLEGEEDVISVEYEQTGKADGVPLYSATVTRKIEDGRIIIEALQPDEIVVDPNCTDRDDMAFACRVQSLRLDEVAALGYDAERAKRAANSGDGAGNRQLLFEVKGERPDSPAEYVDFYDIYVRYDADEDGIAEIHNLVFIGNISEDGLQSDEVVSEFPFFPIRIEISPWAVAGESLYDDVKETQRIRTYLLRQAIDNLTATNNPTPAIISEYLEDTTALYNPEFGKPIRLRAGTRVDDAIQWMQVPFVAGTTFQMLEYLDGELQEATGITDAAAGLAPKDVQNMTATATALIERAGTGRVAKYVKTIARDLVPFFQYLLRLVVRHADREEIIQISGDWLAVDPRSWNADRNCTVNIGLGAGSRERDLAAINYVIGLQREILQNMGPINPYVKPEHLYHSLRRAIEAAGLQTPDLYIDQPSEEEVNQLLQLWKQKLINPEEMKVQAELQLQQARVQGQLAIERMKAEVAKTREMAQLQADLQVKDKEAQLDVLKAEMEAQTRKEIEEIRAQNQILIEEMRLQNERALKLMEIDMEEYRRLAEKLDEADREALATLAKLRANSRNEAGGSSGAGE